MRRVLLSLGTSTLLLTVAIGVAQPPVPPTAPIPATPPAIPAIGTTPAAATAIAGEVPLAQFEPLSSFPQPTQSAVRAVVYGSNWMTRMNQPQGRFQFGYRPALRQPMEGDHDLKQARAALALSQTARFSGDERQTAIASQAILSLLSVTRADPADAKCRIPVVSSMTCNRVGFASVLALSIYELPGADEKLIAEAERLCEFLHRQLRVDGSVHYIDSLNELPVKVDPAGVNEYPGVALHALAVSLRVKPAAWKAEALKKGIEHYHGWFKANPHPMLVATLTPAFAEFYLSTKSNEAAAAAFEMNDWLIGLQYPTGDPRHANWSGGFKGFANGQAVESEPACEGCYLQSLACSYQLVRFTADLARATKYKQAIQDSVQFLTGLQYSEANTRHFENGFRANQLIGGFYLSPTDGNLRIDATACAVSGLLRFLSCGAEKN